MESKILSKKQTEAIKMIPHIGLLNFKSAGIAPNTIESLVKLGLITRENDYVKRN